MAIGPLITSVVAGYDLNWPLLGNVGDSYGSIGAVLTSAALIGVVVTVNLQSRQNTVIAEQAVRQMQLEMMRELWRDPELLQALEIVPENRRELASRYVYINMYIMYLRMGLITGHVSAAEIEDLAAHMFSTSAGSFYWKHASDHLRRHFEKRFVQALTRGYERSTRRAEGVFLEDDPQSPAAESPADRQDPKDAETDGRNDVA
ncbi:MAG TPA: DUF6082 family protein [Kineosporiaceae bacterium]|nr:DUF6082 family protein [Kineosporiaceae bacterium]